MKLNLESNRTEIILDGRILSEETIIDQPLGRQTQITDLRTYLKPMLRGHSPMNGWAYGPASSGKTTIVRWVVDNICSNHALRIGIHVNCWQHRTLYSVVQAMINQLKILGAEAQDTDFKLARIRQAFQGKSVVVILDEVDRLMPVQREEIIYGLLKLPQTGVICIANNTQALATMDERVRSRLCPVLVEFPVYSTGQIQEILTVRANQALAPGSWSPLTIKHIADAVGGDSRMAIQILRQAAAIAEETGHDKLKSRSIDRILYCWENVNYEARMARLSEHEKIIQKLVQQHGPLGTTNLIKCYVNYCHKHNIQPLARRTFSKYLKRLSSAGILNVANQSACPGGRIVQAA